MNLIELVCFSVCVFFLYSLFLFITIITSIVQHSGQQPLFYCAKLIYMQIDENGLKLHQQELQNTTIEK